MKLKTIKVQVNGQDQEVAVVRDGMPLYEDDKGAEIAFDAPHAVATIKRVSDERETMKTRAETAELAAKAFVGVDIEKAKKAMETVANLDAKKLVDAGEVQRVRDEAQATMKEQLATATAEHQQKEADLTKRLHETMLASAFGNSKHLAEKGGQPIALVRSYFGPHFTVQDDKVVTLIDGKPLMSKEKPGETASFDEAIAYRIAADPHKDHWYKTNGATGAGSQSGLNPAPANGRDANFQNLPPSERMKVARREGATSA
jgi:hypothetical protein